MWRACVCVEIVRIQHCWLNEAVPQSTATNNIFIFTFILFSKTFYYTCNSILFVMLSFFVPFFSFVYWSTRAALHKYEIFCIRCVKQSRMNKKYEICCYERTPGIEKKKKPAHIHNSRLQLTLNTEHNIHLNCRCLFYFDIFFSANLR